MSEGGPCVAEIAALPVVARGKPQTEEEKAAAKVAAKAKEYTKAAAAAAEWARAVAAKEAAKA
jgi:hypothetical protein